MLNGKCRNFSSLARLTKTFSTISYKYSNNCIQIHAERIRCKYISRCKINWDLYLNYNDGSNILNFNHKIIRVNIVSYNLPLFLYFMTLWPSTCLIFLSRNLDVCSDNYTGWQLIESFVHSACHHLPRVTWN